MKKIMLSHGGGGEEMNSLINETIFKIFDNEILRQSNDSAILNLNRKIAFSSDSFVVTPIFFNGGDIGKIAACGTINDLAMVGASAKYLSCSLIIEEGLSIEELERVLGSLAKTCKDSGVSVVCGEIVCEGVELKNLKAGAKILISGDVGRHGGVVLAAREEFELGLDLKSDCKSLKEVVLKLFSSGIKPQTMRDATRGGLSAVLNEWAKFSKFDILVFEENIKVADEVMGVCELFGFEPYELANEGTFVMAVDESQAEEALKILREFDKNAMIIGKVLESKNERVIIENAYKSRRFLEPPKGELLPRIC